MNNLFLLLFLGSFICLIVGLVKPIAFSRFIKGEITRKKIGLIFGIATFAFFVLFGITTDTSKNNQVAQQPATENTQVATENENPSPAPATVAENQAPTKIETKPTPTPTETKPAVASFGNGTHIIGTDIKAGTYRSQGKSTCYWARQKGFGGQLDDIIANGNNSPEIVTIDATDAAFQTSGCGQWVAVESTYPATPAASFSNGTYEVGKHIISGTYRADGSPDSLCYWARLSNFSHAGISGVITNGNSPTVIQISTSDKGFTAFGCGTWTKI